MVSFSKIVLALASTGPDTGSIKPDDRGLGRPTAHAGLAQECPLPDGASRGRDGADQASEIRLRNVDLQRGDLGVEWPEGRRRSLFFMVQGGELDLDGRAGESEGAPAMGGEQWIRLRVPREEARPRGASLSHCGWSPPPHALQSTLRPEWHAHAFLRTLWNTNVASS